MLFPVKVSGAFSFVEDDVATPQALAKTATAVRMRIDFLFIGLFLSAKRKYTRFFQNNSLCEDVGL